MNEQRIKQNNYLKYSNVTLLNRKIENEYKD